MKKQFEEDRMNKKIVLDVKRTRPKNTDDEEGLTEWTVSRPETREFGKENQRKKTESEKSKSSKKFKESSIYDKNYLKYNQVNAYSFNQPLYDSKQNDGFKFIDMNLFRYKRVEEQPLDYDRYIGYKNNNTNVVEFDKSVGQDYLREY